MDRDYVIDTSGDLLGSDVQGTLRGAIDLSEGLAHSGDVKACVGRQWLRFALGRSVTGGDEAAFASELSSFESSGNMHSLVAAIASADAFRLRRIP